MISAKLITTGSSDTQAECEGSQAPEGWKVIKLNNYLMDKPTYGINASAVEYSDDLPAYLRITDIDEQGRFSAKKKSSVKDANWRNYLLEEGDLVFARTGNTTGKSYLYSKKDGELVYAGFLIRIRPNQKLLLPEYLFQYAQTHQYWHWVTVMSARGGQPGINGTEYGLLELPLPPLPEQQKIAAILGTWDEAIQKCEQTIATLKTRNKGLAQQLLSGKKRLKGFEGEWVEYSFNDIADRITRRNEELDDTVVTISAQRGFVRQEDFFKKRVASTTLSNYYLIHRGEFAYNKSYSNGYPMGAFKRLESSKKAVVTTLYICFSLKAGVSSDFMVHFFEAGGMVKNLMRIAQEGGRAHGLLNIGVSDFFELKLTLPTLREQQAIAKVLNEADRELQLYQQKLTTLKDQKKGLMQKLLTWEVRVKTENA